MEGANPQASELYKTSLNFEDSSEAHVELATLGLLTNGPADIQRLNSDLIESLTKAGITFNEPDKQAFRDALKAGGFYGEWKEKFGPEAWGLLEKYAGTL